MAGQHGPHQDHVHIERSADDVARFNYFYLARSALIESPIISLFPLYYHYLCNLYLNTEDVLHFMRKLTLFKYIGETSRDKQIDIQRDIYSI